MTLTAAASDVSWACCSSFASSFFNPFTLLCFSLYTFQTGPGFFGDGVYRHFCKVLSRHDDTELARHVYHHSPVLLFHGLPSSLFSSPSTAWGGYWSETGAFSGAVNSLRFWFTARGCTYARPPRLCYEGFAGRRAFSGIFRWTSAFLRSRCPLGSCFFLAPRRATSPLYLAEQTQKLSNYR